jgi:hypothetical protein
MSAKLAWTVAATKHTAVLARAGCAGCPRSTEDDSIRLCGFDDEIDPRIEQ